MQQIDICAANCCNNDNKKKQAVSARYLRHNEIGLEMDLLDDLHFDTYVNRNQNKGNWTHFALNFSFVITWTIFGWVIYFLSNITQILFNNITQYYFACLLILTTILKILLKKIARKIDIIRINSYSNYSYNNNNGKSQFLEKISFEMFLEYIVSLWYYYVYYANFVAECALANLNTFLFKVLLLHMFAEICQSLIRFSKQYYDITLKLYNQFNNYDSMKNSWLLNLLKDKSSFDEWRTRQSIDMSLRYFAVTMAIFVIGASNVADVIIAAIEQTQVIKDAHDFETLLYVLISILVDQVYFAFIFVMYNGNICNISNGTSLNIFEPVLSIFETNRKILAVMFLFGSSLLVPNMMWLDIIQL